MRQREQAIGSTLLLLAGLACSEPQPDPIRFGGATMGTSYQLTLAQPPAQLQLDALRAEVQRILERVDATMSTYRPDSELSRFNESAHTDWFEVSADTQQVVASALRIAAVSGGAFDPTVGPLVELWGFGASGGGHAIPGECELQAALATVGRELLETRCSPPALRKLDPGVRIDLSGIAKGFAVDALARHLQGLGVRDFLVEIGGELRAGGQRAAAQPWIVAVESPEEGSPGRSPRSAQCVLRLRQRAIASSGDYREFFERGGMRYAHVVDPRSGQPVQRAVLSASVMASTAMEADAYATALMVLGPEQGLRLAQQQRLGVQLIVHTGGETRVIRNPAFELEVIR